MHMHRRVRECTERARTHSHMHGHAPVRKEDVRKSSVVLGCTHKRTHTHAYTHAHVHARTHARTHTCTHTNACIHTCTRARKYARTHTHARAHTRSRTRLPCLARGSRPLGGVCTAGWPRSAHKTDGTPAARARTPARAEPVTCVSRTWTGAMPATASGFGFHVAVCVFTFVQTHCAYKVAARLDVRTRPSVYAR